LISHYAEDCQQRSSPKAKAKKKQWEVICNLLIEGIFGRDLTRVGAYPAESISKINMA
jgi:hypothetical protein